MIRIDSVTAALDLLEQAVAQEGPDHVYEFAGNRCVYAYDGQPSCLVGRVLALAGATVEDLEKFDRGGSSVNGLLSAGFLPYVAPDVVPILSIAQICQDSGGTWGEALRVARERADEYAVGAR